MATESPHKACVEVIIRKPDGYVFPPSRMTLTQLVETVVRLQSWRLFIGKFSS